MKPKFWMFTGGITLMGILLQILLWKIVFNEFNTSTVIRSILNVILTMGLLIWWGPKLAKRYSKKLLGRIPAVELLEDEQLLLEDGASHFRGMEAVGGKLSLTNKRLVFTSHKFNIQNHQQEFPVTEIKRVAPFEHQFSDKIFKLELANNEIHKFLVDSPAEWIRTIPQ